MTKLLLTSFSLLCFVTSCTLLAPKSKPWIWKEASNNTELASPYESKYYEFNTALFLDSVLYISPNTKIKLPFPTLNGAIENYMVHEIFDYDTTQSKDNLPRGFIGIATTDPNKIVTFYVLKNDVFATWKLGSQIIKLQKETRSKAKNIYVVYDTKPKNSPPVAPLPQYEY